MGGYVVLSEEEFIDEINRGQQLEQRWLIGGDSLYDAAQLPNSWRSLIESLPPERRNLSVLALVAQQKSLLVRSTHPESEFLSGRTLPQLPLPVLPEHLRFLFRACLESVTKTTYHNLDSVLLHLVYYRGYVSHPFDWLPKNTDDTLPEVYWPWARWQSNISQFRSTDALELTSENWDHWLPAERLSLLKKMRVNSAEQARLLLEQHAVNESADKRVKLIETLSVNLSQDDAAFLKTLAFDRSKKVTALAQQFLLRLSSVSAPLDREPFAETLQELSQVYDLKSTGIIRKSKKFVPKKLKNSVQRGTRTQTIGTIPLALLAAEFDLSLSELASIWDFGANTQNDNLAFVENAAESMPLEELEILVANFLNSDEKFNQLMYWLNRCLHRFTDQKRESFVVNLLMKNDSDTLVHDVLLLLDKPSTEITWADIKSSSAWKNLINDLKEQTDVGGFVEGSLILSLQTLGLYLPKPSATEALKHIIDLGMSQSDPALMCLKLNAQLESSENTKG